MGEGVHVQNEEVAADEQGTTWGSAEKLNDGRQLPPPHCSYINLPTCRIQFGQDHATKTSYPERENESVRTPTTATVESPMNTASLNGWVKLINFGLRREITHAHESPPPFSDADTFLGAMVPAAGSKGIIGRRGRPFTR